MKLRFGLVLVIGLLLAVAAPVRAAETTGKLNVLFIVVDDLNCSVGCYGHPVCKTPNIDRLAMRGVRFERAYCQYPLCNPSRTSFLSGRLPDVTKIIDNNTQPRTTLGKEAVFMPEYFSKHGYILTARVGKVAHGAFEDAVKWDISENSKQGAKEKQVSEKVELIQQGDTGGIKLTWTMTNKEDKDEPDELAAARRIVQILEKNKDKPFFVAAGFHKPHLPWIAPKKYFDMYPPDKIELPKEPPNVRMNVPPIAYTKTKGDAEMTDLQKKQAIAAYYACTTFTDAQIGVILDAVDRLKLWDNTVVVFCTDHGWHLGDHGGLWRKMTLFEQAAQVPMIIAMPGQKPAVSPRLVELLDLYPTLIDLCGLPSTKELEGTSLRPLLDEPKREWNKVAAYTIVARNAGGGKGSLLGRTVRSERYRYTEWGNEKEAELYDQDNDPKEYKNLAKDPQYAEVLALMRKHLQERWKTKNN